MPILHGRITLQVQVWAIGTRQELAPPPGSGTRHATTHRGAFARRALAYVLLKVGHGAAIPASHRSSGGLNRAPGLSTRPRIFRCRLVTH